MNARMRRYLLTFLLYFNLTKLFRSSVLKLNYIDIMYLIVLKVPFNLYQPVTVKQ